MNKDFWGEAVQPKRKNSKSKGLRGEYEIRNILREHFPDKVIERNLEQNRKGGVDFICFPPFQIEIKYREVFQINSWWNELLAKCKTGEIPVLIYRRNRMPWTVVTSVSGFCFESKVLTAEEQLKISTDLPSFIRILKHYVKRFNTN